MDLQSSSSIDGNEEKLNTILNSIEGLTIYKRISKSNFSNVFVGNFNNRKVAVKIIDKKYLRRATAEVAILNEMSSNKRCVQLIQVFDENSVIAIFEYSEAVSERYFYEHISYPRFRFILRSLLHIVSDLKSNNIVHRDIKFSNMLITRHFTELKLCGFGSGSFVFKRMSPTAGSRCCRSPEMLLGYRMYKYACDSWAVGMFILWVLCEGNIPFAGKNAEEFLISMSRIYGSEELVRLMNDYNLHPSDVDASKFSAERKVSFEEMFSPRMKELATDDVVSMMKGFLIIDPEKRLTVDAALKSKMFRRI
jgi:casein kinase II subunit alpha